MSSDATEKTGKEGGLSGLARWFLKYRTHSACELLKWTLERRFDKPCTDSGAPSGLRTPVRGGR